MDKAKDGVDTEMTITATGTDAEAKAGAGAGAGAGSCRLPGGKCVAEGASALGAIDRGD